MAELAIIVEEGERRSSHLDEAVREADIVALRHGDGRWTLVKYRQGPTMKRVPWDELPSDVKTRLPRA